MDKNMKHLLENVLNDEQKELFKDQMRAKINEAKKEAKKEVEDDIRQEMSERYEHSIAHLTEALDKALTDAVQNYATQTGLELKRLKEERSKLTKAIKETRQDYKNKLAKNSTRITEAMNELEGLISANLAEEIEKTRKERKEFKEEKAKYNKKLKEAREKLEAETAKRINKLESFVKECLEKELEEFEEDKKELATRRATLEKDAKRKIEEARQEFVKRSAKLVESKVNDALTKQLTKLKEDIQVAKENTLGQKIFETFQSEFMSTALSHGSLTKKLQNNLEATRKELSEARAIINDQLALVENTKRKASLQESQAKRLSKINDLLRPLPSDKREVMENLLESVKTEKLEESFKKYLPAVIGEEVRNSRRTNLIENKKVNRITEATGNRPVKPVQEVESAEIIELKRLAGLGK